MKDKDFVLKCLPTARAEKHDNQKDGIYWLIRNRDFYWYLASGKTEKEAWANAKKLLTKEPVKCPKQ